MTIPRPLLLFLLCALPISKAAADGATFQLAKELLAEQTPELAAVEFRRFAMETNAAPAQAAAYLYAGYAYLQAGKPADAGEMLDRAESADRAEQYPAELALLNAESARAAKDSGTALYYYDLLASRGGNPSFQTFAHRRAAAVELAKGDIAAARMQLGASTADETDRLRALEQYAAGKDKSPFVGGLWGLIPGAGYWYSGETANGFRSLLLNGLFIFGMAHTAERDQWGAFGAIAFFEVTWYSGSIYGGVDAAHRYNKKRLDTALDAIEGDLSCQPDPAVTVPIFKLKVEF